MLLTTMGVVGIALLVATHLGLGGAVYAASRWLGCTAAGLIIVPVVLVLGHAVVPAALVLLRRRARRAKDARPAP